MCSLFAIHNDRHSVAHAFSLSHSLICSLHCCHSFIHWCGDGGALEQYVCGRLPTPTSCFLPLSLPSEVSLFHGFTSACCECVWFDWGNFRFIYKYSREIFCIIPPRSRTFAICLCTRHVSHHLFVYSNYPQMRLMEMEWRWWWLFLAETWIPFTTFGTLPIPFVPFAGQFHLQINSFSCVWVRE